MWDAKPAGHASDQPSFSNPAQTVVGRTGLDAAMEAAAGDTTGVTDAAKQQQAALMLRQLLLQQQGANQQVSKKSRELYVGRA